MHLWTLYPKQKIVTHNLSGRKPNTFIHPEVPIVLPYGKYSTINTETKEEKFICSRYQTARVLYILAILLH
jgi:hypothetical protein